MPLYPSDGTGVGASGIGSTTADWKNSVRVATTTNITLSGTQTIDSIVLVVGDRVLVKNQTTASQNGIYVVASGTWTRAEDANNDDKVTSNIVVSVEEGTTNGASTWRLSTANPITLGTTGLTFTSMAGGTGASPVGAKGDVQLKGTGANLDYEAAAGHGFNYDTNNHTLTIGPAGTNLSNNPLSVDGNVNSYVQSNVQNLSNGTVASSDMVVTADNGNDNTGYVDLGINSSGYADATFSINGPGDGYLYCSGGDMSIGTETAGKNIIFFTNGTLSTNERGRITSAGSWVVGLAALTTTATDGFMYLAGSAGAPTGVPTAYAGRSPMTFDTTNNVFYFYTNSTWWALDPTVLQVDWKNSVRVATTAALAANTRSGNVLTKSGNGALGAIDGVTLVAGERLLVKDEATGANNGIYVVTDAGAANRPWVLTRASDANTSNKVTSGLVVYVSEGTSNGGETWQLSTVDPITLNTTTLSFTQQRTSANCTEVNAAGDITITSMTDTLATSMTLTPGAGTYLVTFSSDWSNNTNSASMFASIYVGSKVTNSERQYTRSTTVMRTGVMLQCLVTVSSAQAIEVRWRVSAGTGTMGNRSLALIKVG